MKNRLKKSLALLLSLLMALSTMSGLAMADDTETPDPDTCTHEWGEAVWDWSFGEDNLTASASVSRTCEKCGTTETLPNEENPDAVTITWVDESPYACVPGNRTYTAEAVFDITDTVDSERTVEIPATEDHTWGAPVFTWSEDYSNAYATRECIYCGEVERKDATVTITSEPEDPGCEDPVTTIYTATVYFDGVRYTNQKTKTTAAPGHQWGEPEFDWTDFDLETGAGTVSVSRFCTVCGQEDGPYEARVTSETTRAKCTEDGKIVYTATYEFADGTTAEDENTYVLEALGHDWGTPTFDWTDFDLETGKGIVTASHTCNRCGSGETVKCIVTYEKISEPDCTKPGDVIYTAEATFENGDTATNSKDGTIPAQDHDWMDVAWNWTWNNVEGTYDASVDLICKRCGERVTVDAEVEITDQTDPTCTTNGEIEYTATATVTGSVTGYTYTFVSTKTDEIEALGHDWGTPTFDWTDFDLETGEGTVTASRTCTRCNAEDPDGPYEADVTKNATSSDPTCTEAGRYDYTATVEIDKETYEDHNGCDMPALGHDWGEIEWIWNDDYSSAQATRECNRCHDKEFYDAVVSSETTPATCTDPEETIYTATAVIDGVEVTDTEGPIETGEPLGHDWGEVTFNWDNFDLETGEGTVTASRTCNRCDTTETYDATVTVSNTPATCTDPEETVYIATVEIDEQTYKDTKDVEGKAALGHDWSDAVFDWSDYDYETQSGKVTATRECNRCGIDETVYADVTYEITEEASCTEPGEIVFTATAEFSDDTATDEKTFEIPAQGHTWGEIEWNWAADLESATASRTCKVCGEVETEKADVTFVKTDATCITDGYISSDGTVEFGGMTYTDHQEMVLPALGHEWFEEATWVTDYDACLADVTRTCSRCGYEETNYGVELEETVSPATCTEGGKIVYTGSTEFDDDGIIYTFEGQVDTGDALGHNWNTPVFYWNDDLTNCIVTRTCARCGDVEYYVADITEDSYTAPTCQDPGEKTCTATVEIDGVDYSDTETIEIPVLDHIWGNITWTWADDYSSAYVTRECEDCGIIERADAVVTPEVTVEPTCTTEGETTYTAVAVFEDDGEEYTDVQTEAIPALGHTWGSEISWTWSDDLSSAKASRTCEVCGYVDTVDAVVTSEVTVEPTCTDAGEMTFTATATFDGDDQVYTDVQTAEIAALGHDWGDPTWTWSSNYSIASATFTCKNCGRVESAIAVVTSEVTLEPTCTTYGQIVYTATATFDGKPYTDTESVPIDALGHSYGAIEFSWSSDYSSATATRTCEVCEYVDTANVTVSSVTTDPTCTEAGQTVYTANATFSDGTTATDTKTVEIEALGHDWGEQPTWTWSNNYSVAEAAFTCERCGRVETAIAFVTSETTEPTCTVAGQTVYTATATFNGKQYVDKMEVTLDALGHTFGAAEFTWSADYSSATATRTCEVCKYVDTANVTVSSVTTDPTCTDAGQTVYTATATFSDGTTATDTRTVAIDALGHSWGEPTWSWNGNYSVADATFECSRCGTVDSALGVITSETTEPTCTTDGKTVYNASVTFNGVMYDAEPQTVVIPATGHTWGDVVWTWSSDNSSATATRTCEVCGTEDTANVVVSSETTEPTNTQDGKTVYTATATFSDGTVDTDTKTVVIPAKGGPNTSALEQDIDLADSLDEDNYTEESWNNLQEALKAAEEVLNDDNATQAEVDAAADALAKAVEELVPAEEETGADKTALDIAISAAEALDESEYTAESWEAMQNALSVAEAICNSSSSTQDQVDAVLDILLSAIASLDKNSASTETDKTTLDVAISAAGTLVSSDYTSESWTLVEDAVKAAEAVLNDDDATQDQVNAAFDVLEKAINALVKADTGELFTGFKLNSADGNWYYYIDSEIAYGLNSVLEGTVNGSNGWWYVVNGQVQLNYTGVCDYCNDYGWWYVVNGKVDFSKNSVEQNKYGWWYVLGGKVDFSYTGVANYANAYGWWYIKDGKVDFSKTSIEPNQYGWWRVVNGKVDFSCNSVEQNDYGWWYIVGGQVQFGYTGVANYANAYGWWYIKDGKVDFSKTSIEPNQYGWWRVVKGQVDFSCNSVEQNDYGWWYVVGGKVDFSYTGVADYANAYGWWYIKEGKVDFSFTGWATNSYGRWYCVNGKVDFSRS